MAQTLTIVMVLLVAAFSIACVINMLMSYWERAQWRRNTNEQRRERALDRAPLTRTWIEDVAWTPWGGTVCRWQVECSYDWTDVNGVIHHERNSWEEMS